MDRRVVALIGLAVLGEGRIAFAQETPPSFVVRVNGHQAVSPTTLERTQIRVERLMSQAGVRLVWRECPPRIGEDAACAAAPAPNEAVVRLRTSTAPLPGHGCGVTLVPDAALTHFVTLFVECIRETADRLQLPEDVLFAGALAHELVHVLLGPAHAAAGLMQARPRPADWLRLAHDALPFTGAEARGMRDALRQRRSEAESRKL